jgi:hypothetical protein
VHTFSRRFLVAFLPAAVAGTIACLIVAVAVQQDLRQGADDPQHQLAEDAVARLDAGAEPSDVVGPASVTVETSLAPFVVVYDPTGKVLAGGGTLGGSVPVPPLGVLETATLDGIDRVTWQPRSSVRLATVVLPWRNGTVLAARSLRRVEDVESASQTLVFIGWLVLLGGTVIAAAVAAWLWPRSSETALGGAADAVARRHGPPAA